MNNKLYEICYEAWRHAESGIYDTGSNYWMMMFVDKLIERIQEAAYEKSI